MLTEFYNTLKELPKEDIDTILLSEKLNDGKTLVLASKEKQGLLHVQTQIKYVFRVEKGILHTYKLFGSTEEQIKMSLCSLCVMDPGIFQVLFDSYLSEKSSYIFECDGTLLENAEMRACIPGGPTTLPMTVPVKKEIYKQFKAVKDDGILFLETPYK